MRNVLHRVGVHLDCSCRRKRSSSWRSLLSYKLTKGGPISKVTEMDSCAREKKKKKVNAASVSREIIWKQFELVLMDVFCHFCHVINTYKKCSTDFIQKVCNGCIINIMLKNLHVVLKSYC